MIIKRMPPPCSSNLVIAIALLHIASFSALSADAASPWVVMHPPVIPELARGLKSIHFIDAANGWAEGEGFHIHPDGDTGNREQNVILRTSDGGQSWQRVEPHGDAHAFPIHFSSPTLGSRILTSHMRGETPNLFDDIEYYHSVDGGLTWQLRSGKVTELIRIGDEVPEVPIEENRRIFDTYAYFVDDQYGWFLGVTGSWYWNWEEEGWLFRKPLA